MKRDMDLIRKILMTLEANKGGALPGCLQYRGMAKNRSATTPCS